MRGQICRGAAINLRPATAEKANTSDAEGIDSSAASAAQPASVAAVGSRGDEPCDIGDYVLELIYSSELDGDTSLKKTAAKTEPDVARRNRPSELTKRYQTR